MNIKRLLPILLSLCLALSGCSPIQRGTLSVVPVPSQPSQTLFLDTTALPKESVSASRTPRPTATHVPTITFTPVPTFTSTADPAIFAPKTFGDIRKVDSFVLIENWKSTGQDYLNEQELKFEYQRDPAKFHSTTKYHGFEPYGSETTTSYETYWLEEWAYSKDNLSGLWGATRAVKENFNEFPLNKYDFAKTINISYFRSARYLGVEQYKGVPAFHYSFDERNLIEMENMKIDKAVGELFVSVEGRYPLHSFARFSGKVIPAPGQDPPWAEGVVERTQDLVSFNQQVQINLPADYPNFTLNLDFPVPLGSILNSVNQDDSGGVHYNFVTPANEEQYKAFYTFPDPTSGWSVLGSSDVHYGDFWCTACPMFRKGYQKVALDFRDDKKFATHIAYHIYVNFLPLR